MISLIQDRAGTHQRRVDLKILRGAARRPFSFLADEPAAPSARRGGHLSRERTDAFPPRNSAQPGGHNGQKETHETTQAQGRHHARLTGPHKGTKMTRTTSPVPENPGRPAQQPRQRTTAPQITEMPKHSISVFGDSANAPAAADFNRGASTRSQCADAAIRQRNATEFKR
jgi:hypothetical protein